MSLDTAAPKFTERSWSGAVSLALRLVLVLALLAIIIQAAIVVRARPQDLITGGYGMADIIRRAMPPDFSKIDMVWWPALETIDLGIFGTVGGVIMALPLAVLAAANVTPSRALYYIWKKRYEKHGIAGLRDLPRRHTIFVFIFRPRLCR